MFGSLEESFAHTVNAAASDQFVFSSPEPEHITAHHPPHHPPHHSANGSTATSSTATLAKPATTRGSNGVIHPEFSEDDDQHDHAGVVIGMRGSGGGRAGAGASASGLLRLSQVLHLGDMNESSETDEFVPLSLTTTTTTTTTNNTNNNTNNNSNTTTTTNSNAGAGAGAGVGGLVTITFDQSDDDLLTPTKHTHTTHNTHNTHTSHNTPHGEYDNVFGCTDSDATFHACFDDPAAPTTTTTATATTTATPHTHDTHTSPRRELPVTSSPVLLIHPDSIFATVPEPENPEIDIEMPGAGVSPPKMEDRPRVSQAWIEKSLLEKRCETKTIEISGGFGKEGWGGL